MVNADERRVVRHAPKLPRRKPAAHKGDFGTVVVVAGSATMPGAAILCARAALRGGAGRVQLGLPDDLLAICIAAVPGAIGVGRGAALDAALVDAAAIVLGPGLGVGADARRLVARVLRRARSPIVVDADALNVLAPLRRPLRTSATAVLTPHPGEAARLLGTTAAEVQADRMTAATTLQQRSGAVVVLKGAGTIVCAADATFTNRTGNPGLATAGSGDVLAGLLAACLAQGMAPFDAACLSVDVHGRAGNRVAKRLSEAGLCAEDLPLAIAEELR